MNKNNTLAMPTPKAAITPGFIYKKIGNTKYRVAAHFSSTSKERMDDKIMRLAENDLNIDLNYDGICGKIELPQTGAVAVGGSL